MLHGLAPAHAGILHTTLAGRWPLPAGMGPPVLQLPCPCLQGVRPTILRACAQPLTRCLPLSAGIVPTKFAAALVENPELEQAQKDATLVKRLGRPEDMAAAVAYLCSDDASYVTGETIVVSGGLQSRL